MRKAVFMVVATAWLAQASLISMAQPVGEKARLGIFARYHHLAISGNVTINNSIAGTKVNLENDLRLKDADLPEVGLEKRFGQNHWLRASWIGMSFEGHSLLKRSGEE